MRAMLHLLLCAALAADPAGPPTATDLGWLAGTWARTEAGKTVEETWTRPAGETLMGVSRTVQGDHTVFHEFLRIEPRDGLMTYVALPKGAESATPFTWVEGGPTWARFENLQHDFPTSLKYVRTGDSLHIEVRGDDGKGFDVDLKKQAAP